MNESLYYDKFAETVVTEKDAFAPPERYFEIAEGVDNDTFIDRYYIPNNKRICYSYTVETSWVTNADIFNRNVCDLIYSYGAKPEEAILVCRVYPKDRFKNIKESICRNN